MFALAVRTMLLASASILLYAGLGMLLLVPHAAGEPYWAKERFTYGVLPLFLGFALATVCGRTAVHRPQPDELMRSMQRYWLFAFCGVPAVFAFLCLNDSV
jgi:hypothetical protein